MKLLLAVMLFLIGAIVPSGAAQFKIDPAQSAATLTGESYGSRPVPQGSNSMTAHFAGTLNATLTVTHIQFTEGSTIIALTNGVWSPGRAGATNGPADYGFYANLITATAAMALRDVELVTTSPPLVISQGLFAPSGVYIWFPSNALPVLDFAANNELQGEDKQPSGSPGFGLNVTSYFGKIGVTNGVTTITLPFNFVFTYPDLAHGNNSYHLEGQLVATSEPLLLTRITATPTLVSPGDTVNVAMTAVNGSTQAVLNVQPKGPLVLTGTQCLSLTSGPDPAQVATLEAEAKAAFNYAYLATNVGRVTIAGDAQGQVKNESVTFSNVTSASVLVSPGDLLIKRGSEAVSNYVGRGILQTAAASPQIKTNGVLAREASIFQIQVVNQASQPKTFVLGSGSSLPSNWQASYRSGSQDITAAMQSGAGAALPELAPGGALVVNASFTTTSPAGTAQDVDFTLRASDDPSAILDVVRARTQVGSLPLQFTLRRLIPSGATDGSVAAGLSDPNALVEPVPDVRTLQSMPSLAVPDFTDSTHTGLVADGVTPLLIQVSTDPTNFVAFPDGRLVRAALQVTSANSIRGTQPGDALQVLDPVKSVWKPDLEFRLSKDQPTTFLWVAAVTSDAVQIVPTPITCPNACPQVDVKATITDSATSMALLSQTFAIRKPPAFLLHGYNSHGQWSSDFRAQFWPTRWGGLSVPEASPDNFVRMVLYGQDDVRNTAQVHVPVLENTVYSLEDCAALALESLEAHKDVLLQSWAMTRYDVVGHSQGGVLARMLCNQQANSKVKTAYRNINNFNRGRFHRVVTLGAPHNGSRILRYLLQVTKRHPLPKALDSLQPLLQQKFDPFGGQIHAIHNPDPSAPWFPDPSASFHLVRTVIDQGRSPSAGDRVPEYQALDFNQPGPGAAVIPRGSDGIVDFDSATANVPPASVGASVYQPPTDISHATPLALFFNPFDPQYISAQNQVDSPTVGKHVAHALDQTPADPSENVQFGPFQLPPYLADSDRQAIDQWAATSRAAPDSAAQITSQSSGLQSLGRTSSAASLTFGLQFGPSYAPLGEVNWLVYLYGPDGLSDGSTDGVTLALPGTNSAQVMVKVDPALVGDVVLQAFYHDDAGELVITPARVVLSRQPAGVTLIGMQVLPADPTLPVGSELIPEMVGLYSDQSASLRYVTAEGLSVQSSDTNIVSVADPLRWQLLAPGTAQVWVQWSGFRATNQVTVFTSTPVLPVLSIASVGMGTWTLRYPAWATEYLLEQTPDLSPGHTWQPVLATPTRNGSDLSVNLPVQQKTEYFRLRR